MLKTRFLGPAVAAGAAVLLAAGGAGAAEVLTASSAATTTTIHACRKDSNGELFLWPTCPNGYTAYEWNVTGPAGRPGARGPAGTSATLPKTIIIGGTKYACKVSGDGSTWTCAPESVTLPTTQPPPPTTPPPPPTTSPPPLPPTTRPPTTAPPSTPPPSSSPPAIP
jgi:hypothetical protein